MSIEGFLQAVIEDVIDDAGSSVNEDTTSDYLEGLLDGKTSVMRFLSQHGIITERQYGDFLLESDTTRDADGDNYYNGLRG